jgi:hypothetical protein
MGDGIITDCHISSSSLDGKMLLLPLSSFTFSLKVPFQGLSITLNPATSFIIHSSAFLC